MSKYHSQKATVDGKTFDSLKEARRYMELSLLQKAGAISSLQCQVPFELIPKQTKNGKCLERAVTYIADFVYFDDGVQYVEDVKGYKKGQAYAVFTIKRKLMLWVHGIQVREV